MPLDALSAEVQKTIITLLDYASLCQLRSTSRYYYNFLTETEIHEVFLDTQIEQHEMSLSPKDGQTCANCIRYCDATQAQVKNANRAMMKAQKEVTRAGDELVVSHKGVTAAHVLLKEARTAVTKTKVKKEKKQLRVKVLKAEEQLKAAKGVVKSAEADVSSAQKAKRLVATESPDLARTCYTCKRKYNGYMKPGILELAITPKKHWAINMVCSRETHIQHYNHRIGYVTNFEKMQKDGKICNVCWKGTRRGASTIQRRKAFIEDFGYWLREVWLAGGKAVREQAEAVEKKTFKEIEKEKEWIDAVKALEALKEAKAEAGEEV